MRILLTNDDGYFAPGILAFAKETRKRGHEVVIFAPDKENSAKSHSITILEPLYVKKVEIEDFEKAQDLKEKIDELNMKVRN